MTRHRKRGGKRLYNDSARKPEGSLAEINNISEVLPPPPLSSQIDGKQSQRDNNGDHW